jgi:hypothetical protein
LTNINLYDTNPIIISTFRVPMERIAQWLQTLREVL